MADFDDDLDFDGAVSEVPVVEDRPQPPPTPGLIPGLELPRLPKAARRAAIGVLMVVVAGLFVWAASNADPGPDSPGERAVVVAQFPAPGARALRQTEVGAVLRQGYDGRLVVNGVVIPEEQMEGAVDPSTLSASDLAKYGVRANNRNTVKFRPGEGKVLESLPMGDVSITLTYFPEGRPEDARTLSWTAAVS